MCLSGTLDPPDRWIPIQRTHDNSNNNDDENDVDIDNYGNADIDNDDDDDVDGSNGATVVSADYGW